jgi:TonB family protein
MNRLQKKCLIATAGLHLLLLVILLVGPAFFAPSPKPDDTQVLDVIPASVLDEAINSGARSAQPPPAPAPIVTPQPQPTPPAPKPIVQPPPTPQPTLLTELKKVFTPEPPKPELVPTEIQPHKIQPVLTPVVRTSSQNYVTPKLKDDSQAKLRAEALKAARALEKNLTQATVIDAPGDSSTAVANYASVVKSIYEQAWTPPDDAANDDANTKVSVTISSDGTVITAHIITPSGDSGVDDTVQRTLERVQLIAPFPAGSTDKERTYIINFNLKAKRMLE